MAVPEELIIRGSMDMLSKSTFVGPEREPPLGPPLGFFDMGVRFEPEPEVRWPSDFATALMRLSRHQPVAMIAMRITTTPTTMPARAPFERPESDPGVDTTLATGIEVGVNLLTAAVATGLGPNVGWVEGTYAVLMTVFTVLTLPFESVVVMAIVTLTVGNFVS